MSATIRDKSVVIAPETQEVESLAMSTIQTDTFFKSLHAACEQASSSRKADIARDNASITLSWSWFLIDTRICPFGSSFGNFLACQRFRDVSRSGSWCRRNTTGFIPWLTMHPQISQCFYHVLRYSYNCFQTFRESEACLIVYPSAVNFMRVWCQHN